MIVVDTRPHDVDELIEGVTAFRPSGLIRSEIAGVEVGQPCDGGEISASAQVRVWIDYLHPAVRTVGRAEKVGVPAGEILGLRSLTVATIAVGVRVDDVTAYGSKADWTDRIECCIRVCSVREVGRFTIRRVHHSLHFLAAS